MNISSKVSFGNGCTCPNCTARDGWYTRAQKELANSYSGTACDVYEKISGKEVSAEARQKCANKMFKAADALDWISIGADLAK